MDDPISELSELGVLRVYANRMARRMLLTRFCGDGHPVLEIEENLVQMARSRLQESLLIHFGDLERIKLKVFFMVRKIARERIRTSDVDLDVKNSLLEELEAMSVEELFPLVH